MRQIVVVASVRGRPDAPTEDRLYARAVAILDEARSRVTRTVNSAMVHACWLIGREIVEVEQQGEERAGTAKG